MKPVKVAIVMGTRPEAIKMSPVVSALRLRPDSFEATVVATGQHKEMLAQVLDIFDIKPDVDLDVMRADQGLAELTVRLLTSLDRLWRETPPDIVLVQGDTTSSFAASLAAYYLKLPIGHVEAGLRTRDKYAPFPEEMNRRLVDALADLYFAPTEKARQSLLAEGAPPEDIFVTGNTGIDALLHTLERIQATRFVPPDLNPAMRDYKKLVLITAHRRESFGDGFINICDALHGLARRFPGAAFVYPVHPNPNVQKPVRDRLAGIANMFLIEPLEYRTFVYLMGRANVILTDSGGIQEEAPSLGKPVLVMRGATERMEAVEAGVAELVGTDLERIVERTAEALERPVRISPGANPFGDGRAAERIARIILERLS